MSLLSSFISSQLIAAIEHEFKNNEPQIQNAIVSEVQSFIGDCSAWLEDKIKDTLTDEPTVEPTDESKQS